MLNPSPLWKRPRRGSVLAHRPRLGSHGGERWFHGRGGCGRPLLAQRPQCNFQETGACRVATSTHHAAPRSWNRRLYRGPSPSLFRPRRAPVDRARDVTDAQADSAHERSRVIHAASPPAGVFLIARLCVERAGAASDVRRVDHAVRWRASSRQRRDRRTSASAVGSLARHGASAAWRRRVPTHRQDTEHLILEHHAPRCRLSGKPHLRTVPLPQTSRNAGARSRQHKMEMYKK